MPALRLGVGCMSGLSVAKINEKYEKNEEMVDFFDRKENFSEFFTKSSVMTLFDTRPPALLLRGILTHAPGLRPPL